MKLITNNKKKRVLAIASGGGHWVQMMRLRPAFQESEVHYATTDPKAAEDVAPAPCHTFMDANKDTKIKLIFSTLKIALIVLKVRPDVIISTGAASGYLAIRIGKLIGARTMFIDSVANAKELSLSASMVKRHADRLVSQWPIVARKTGAVFLGSVI